MNRSRKWYDNSRLLLNIKKGSISYVVSFLDFRVLQISNINPKYKESYSFSFCSLNIWLTNVVLFPWFQTSARMWHCLYAYRSLGDNVYGLSKLVPYGSILILFSFFSCTFLVVCVPMERVSHLGKKSCLHATIIQYWHLRRKNFDQSARILTKFHLKAVKM